MERRVALVKSRDDAFRIGIQTELIDETQSQNSKYDSFIMTYPGVAAVKVPEGQALESIKMVYHRYTNLQGNN